MFIFLRLQRWRGISRTPHEARWPALPPCKLASPSRRSAHGGRWRREHHSRQSARWGSEFPALHPLSIPGRSARSWSAAPGPPHTCPSGPWRRHMRRHTPMASETFLIRKAVWKGIASGGGCEHAGSVADAGPLGPRTRAPPEAAPRTLHPLARASAWTPRTAARGCDRAEQHRAHKEPSPTRPAGPAVPGPAPPDAASLTPEAHVKKTHVRTVRCARSLV